MSLALPIVCVAESVLAVLPMSYRTVLLVMAFYHNNINLREIGTRSGGTAVTDLTLSFWEDYGSI